MIRKPLNQLTIRKLQSALILSGMMLFGLLSCDDEPVGPQFADAQNPIEQFVNSLTEGTVSVDDSEYLFGCFFEFQKEGRITDLCVKAPDDDTYGLTLWDLADSTVIMSITIEADSGVLTYADIIDVPVLNGSRMALTMVSDDWYIWEDGGGVIYPATFNDITILAYGLYYEPDGIQFPNEFYNDYYAGLADLVFEPKLE